MQFNNVFMKIPKKAKNSNIFFITQPIVALFYLFSSQKWSKIATLFLKTLALFGEFFL